MLQPLFDGNRDHFTGNPLARIELVQYGDLHSKQCAAAYAEIKFLQEMMGSQLKFVFRHFPLPNLHPLSLEAAVAAEAASLQNKFWEMHDVIFENQRWLTRASLVDFAAGLGLDTMLFQQSREQKSIIEKVIADFESAVKSGVCKAPTFFINGLLYNGSNDFDSLYKTCRYVLNLENAEYNYIEKKYFNHTISQYHIL